MKTYDYKKAKEIIENNKENLSEVSLGMHEDWFWTAETVWKQGEYTKSLPENADEMEEKFISERKNGLRMFLDEKDENGLSKINDEYTNLQQHRIAGLYGSSWATPVIQLIFKYGSEKMIECFNGESDRSQNAAFGLGVLSQPVQDNITPISK